jgi:hypothetical protein
MKRFYDACSIACLVLSLGVMYLLWERGYGHSFALGGVLLIIGAVGSGLVVNFLALRARIEALEKRLEERR